MSRDKRRMDFRGLTGSQRTPRVWGVTTFARRYRPPFGVRVWSPDILTSYMVPAPKMVCFFEVAFDNGIRFPLHPFIKGVLQHFNVCPSQLSPNCWGILVWFSLGTGASVFPVYPCSLIFLARRKPPRASFIFPSVPALRW